MLLGKWETSKRERGGARKGRKEEERGKRKKDEKERREQLERGLPGLRHHAEGELKGACAFRECFSTPSRY
jgi:hypothetical protein